MQLHKNAGDGNKLSEKNWKESLVFPLSSKIYRFMLYIGALISVKDILIWLYSVESVTLHWKRRVLAAVLKWQYLQGLVQ